MIKFNVAPAWSKSYREIFTEILTKLQVYWRNEAFQKAHQILEE